ncbi:MAG TPA: hypothetical protein VNZ86_20245, partial [Bacteroidia bacterium]|nr:hypothetical protein [Bacteroidia bacterium]
KINNGLDPDNGINAGEGAPCPQSGSLTNNNIELVRQWINRGAPQSGYVVDTNVINKFYAGRGLISNPASHPAPTAPGSYQIHVGRVFLDSMQEMEYFQKYDLNLSDTIEVNRIELFMSNNSHHFILYKFISPAAAASFAPGMRILDPLTGTGSSGIASTIVSAWQRSYDFNLPTTTAYSWPLGSVLDLNHHLFNYNPDSTLAVDIYINVYTQPKHTAQSIMYSQLFYNTSIYIPNNGQNITFSHSDYNNSATQMYNVWFMSSHTHKYGVGFNIFERTSSNTTGPQLYDGTYDYTNNVPLGYFDWAHPPVELFSPMHVINPHNGLIAQATYNNYGPAPVQWGLTTKDEMMVYYIQYTLGSAITGIHEEQGAQFKMNL